jgi:hypothetical protein
MTGCTEFARANNERLRDYAQRVMNHAPTLCRVAGVSDMSEKSKTIFLDLRSMSEMSKPPIGVGLLDDFFESSQPAPRVPSRVKP